MFLLHLLLTNSSRAFLFQKLLHVLVEEQVYIEEMNVQTGGGDDEATFQQGQQEQRIGDDGLAVNTGGVGTGVSREMMGTLLSRMRTIEENHMEQFQGVMQSIGSFRTFTDGRLDAIATSVGRMTIQAPRQLWHTMNAREQARMANFGDGNANVEDNENIRRQNELAEEFDLPRVPPLPYIPLCRAKLGDPSDLHALWAEYTHGIAGSKPAKDFTTAERGREKYKYSRRKVVWSLIDEMTNKGYSAEGAIARIYQTYGHKLSVSKITIAIRKDGPKRHPNFQFGAPGNRARNTQ